MMLRKTVSTMTSECFFVRSETRETSSTSSALVMLPLVIHLLLVAGGWRLASGGRIVRATSHEPSVISPIPKVIPERRAPIAGVLLIFLPVGAELVRLQRPDR